MRKLGMNRLHDIEQMTLTEFLYKQQAQQYKEVDKEYELHKAAFLNLIVKGTKGTEKNPKPMYENFKQFFDYDKAIQDLEGEHQDLSDEEAQRQENIQRIAMGNPEPKKDDNHWHL